MKLECAAKITLPTPVLGLAGTPDGARLYAACLDGKVFEVTPARLAVTPFEGVHGSYASGCVLLPEGQTLISAGYDGCLLWHDVGARRLVRRVSAHDFWSWKLALSPDGKRVASVTGQFLAGGEKYEPAPSETPTVKVFDAVSGELVRAFDAAPPVQSVAFSPDGLHLAAANLMGEVRIWEVATGRIAAEFKTPDFTSWGIIKSPHYLGGIFGLSFAPDGASVLGCGMGPMADPMAGNGKMTWQRWSWREGQPKRLSQIREADQGAGLMETLGFAPDGKSFVMAGRQAQGSWTTAIFSESDGALLASLDTKSRVSSHHFAHDGKQLFLGGGHGQHERKDGKWPDFGEIQVVHVEA